MKKFFTIVAAIGFIGIGGSADAMQTDVRNQHPLRIERYLERQAELRRERIAEREAAREAAEAAAFEAAQEAEVEEVSTPPVTYSGSIADLICSIFGSTCSDAIEVASCESGLDPTATNPSGASGLFQLMPGHWEGSFNPYNPAANARYAYGLSNGGTDWGAWAIACRP